MEQINLNGDDMMEGYNQENDDSEMENVSIASQFSKEFVETRTEKHFELMEKVRKYKSTFEVECKDIVISDLDKLSLQELEDKLVECKNSASRRGGNGSMHRSAFKAMLSFGELYVGPAVKMDLTGLTHTAIQDVDLMKCLDECALPSFLFYSLYVQVLLLYVFRLTM